MLYPTQKYFILFCFNTHGWEYIFIDLEKERKGGRGRRGGREIWIDWLTAIRSQPELNPQHFGDWDNAPTK